VFLDVVYASANHPSPATICAAGWEEGCLSRYQAGKKEYYRAADVAPGATPAAPETYLTSMGGKMYVEHQRIPYEALALLNRLSDLAIEDGRLRAAPSIVKMIQASDSWREHHLTSYLQSHSADFRAMLKKLDAG